MDTRFRALAQQLNKLAQDSSYESAASLAATLFQLQDAPREVVRVRILNTATNPEHRTQLESLYLLWQSVKPELSPTALALALLAAAKAQTERRQASTLNLVWTGPDSHVIPLRRTDQALIQLIQEAKTRLLIVSFAVYKVPSIAEALVNAAKRGVEIKLCVESPQESEGKLAYDNLRALGSAVTSRVHVYIWSLSQRPRNEQGKPGALHAKVAVADGNSLLLSSANLTDYAMNLNMELGLAVRGGLAPQEVENHFEELIARRVLELIDR